MYDLVLKGGRVIDPAADLDAVCDVAFEGGKVAAVGENLGPASETRDVAGRMVVPGLIDLHTHVYWGGTSLGVDADLYAKPCGITTLVDAGSAGPGNFAGFRRHVIERCEVRILPFLHISFPGIFGLSKYFSYGESADLMMLDPRAFLDVAREHSDLIVGAKVRIGKVGSGANGAGAFAIAMEAAEHSGLPLMTHLDRPPPHRSEIMPKLRRGDIWTHCFRGFPNAPLTYDGEIQQDVLDARERGVIFDIGHGRGSFGFATAIKMLEHGFSPDVLSSDVHVMSIDGPAFDLLVTMSKFLALGFPLTEIIRTSTINAARAVRREDRGTLQPGLLGDATVLDIEEGDFEFVDAPGEKIRATRRFVCHGAVLAGKMVALNRRTLLAAAGASALARSVRAQPSNARTLRYVPQGNLQNPDPIWTSSVIAKIHGYAIWDTLFGLDSALAPQPQMLAGIELSDDKLKWRLTLREGLRFHDGEPVRATDCIASIARWAKRDGFGQQLLAQLDGMAPQGDRAFEIRLTRPFPALPYALGSGVCFMMPERIARTDAFQQIREYVGSGPFQFVPGEWVSGTRALYTRFEGYVPREEKPDFTAGGKRAQFDRLEWIIEPDPATAAAALQKGEVDWVEQPLVDLLPVLRRSHDIRIESLDRIGSLGVLRPNFLHPPFDNRAMRQALLPAIDQAEYMAAVMGAETELARTGVGVFPAGTPLANDAGLDVLTGPRDPDLAKRLVAMAGYRGERVVLLSPSDFPVVQAIAQVTREVLVRCGIDVDYVSTDWGTVIARRNSREPVERGGWSMFCTYGEGMTLSTPAKNDPLRGDGAKAWYGWPDIPKLETLRSAYYDAADLAAQRAVAEEIQRVALGEVVFYPVGQWVQPTAYRTDLTGVLKSPFPLFWNVARTLH